MLNNNHFHNNINFNTPKCTYSDSCVRNLPDESDTAFIFTNFPELFPWADGLEICLTVTQCEL